MTDPAASPIRARIEAQELYDQGYRGQGVGVAILDSGFLPRNGFDPRVVEERDFTGEGRPRHSSNWHGGTVATCLSVLAPETRPGDFRVIPAEAPMRREDVIAALDAVVAAFPTYRIANLSLSFAPRGCPDACPLCQAVARAYRAGGLVVVAASNEGPAPDTLTCPARAHWALTVTATLPETVNDYWRDHRRARIWARHVTGRFGRSCGTSCSAGYMSGQAAMLFSAFPGQAPTRCVSPCSKPPMSPKPRGARRPARRRPMPSLPGFRDSCARAPSSRNRTRCFPWSRNPDPLPAQNALKVSVVNERSMPGMSSSRSLMYLPISSPSGM